MRRLLLPVLLTVTALAAATAPAHASLTPGEIHRAYGLPSTGAAHQTIAIVSAYDDPHVQNDLSAYTRRFGIPACTVANGCFRVLNQSGSTGPLPQKDPTGGTFITESSVGTEVARGVCQSCAITLVEASSLSEADLSAATATAARAGAQTIVAAFNIPASAGNASFAGDYTTPKALVVASAGDSGYTSAPSFPSSLPGVLAVGGTQLKLTKAGTYGSETAWSQTTSGCALYDAAATWQSALAASAGCGAKRAVADLSAVAEPGPLVKIQDFGAPCGNNWCEADGTSVAAPIIAGVIGLAGSHGSSELQMLYAHARGNPGSFRDIKSGTTQNCTGQAICTARQGYDGPTGLGTPDGLAAFLANGGAVDRHHPALTVTAPRNRLATSRQWATRLTLSNRNAFAVHGMLVLHGRGHRLASASFTIDPLGSTAPTLHINKAQRGLLRRLGRLTVRATVTLRGPAGAAATVSRGLVLSAP